MFKKKRMAFLLILSLAVSAFASAAVVSGARKAQVIYCPGCSCRPKDRELIGAWKFFERLSWGAVVLVWLLIPAAGLLGVTQP